MKHQYQVIVEDYGICYSGENFNDAVIVYDEWAGCSRRVTLTEDGRATKEYFPVN